jgi:nitronate monooxygenase
VAALALGAEGVNMGTRFMATQEAPVHPKVKELLVLSSERDTMLVLRSLRNTLRAFRNPVAEKVAEMEKRGASIEELAPLISGLAGRKC